MRALPEISKEFADSRAIERAATNHNDETHRIFFVTDNGQRTEFHEVAADGDVYEAVSRAMLRVMLKKVRNIEHVRAVIIETHAIQREVPTNQNPMELSDEQIAALPSFDVVMTVAHDGEVTTSHARPIDPEREPVDVDSTTETNKPSGRLQEALETLTLGTLLAGMLQKDKD
jgi:hypothetical protein